MFKALMGFIPVSAGKIEILGQPVQAMMKKQAVAYVPQSEEIDWTFPVLVEDVVMMGRYGHMGFLRRPRAADHAATTAALQRVNMVEFRHRQIGELSGGQKKRVFLARALAQNAQVILLDEPFTGVDVTTEEQIITLLREMRAEGRVMLVATHNLGSVPEFCDRVVLVKGTVLAHGPTEEVFTPDRLRETFGGVLRHFLLEGPRLHDDADPRLWLHDQCDLGVGAGRCGLRLSFGLSDAERLVADRGCAVPFCRAGGGRGLYAGPALRPWRLPVGRACRAGDAVPAQPVGVEGGCGDRPDLHRLLRAGAVHGIAEPDGRVDPDHHHGQYPRHHTRGHAATGADRGGVAGHPAGEMAGSAGGLLRRGACAFHRAECHGTAAGLLHPAFGLDRGGDADGGGVSGDRACRYAGRDGLSADRPLSPAAGAVGGHRITHFGLRRLSQLFPRRCDRGGDCLPSDAAVSGRVLLRPQAWHAGGPRPRESCP
ncbi:UNVERIFIED_CONTAM: yfeB [Trichonephila clavipes]